MYILILEGKKWLSGEQGKKIIPSFQCLIKEIIKKKLNYY